MFIDPGRKSLTYNEEVRRGIDTLIVRDRGQSPPREHTIGGVSHDGNAKRGVDRALGNRRGEERGVRVSIPWRLITDIAIVGAGNGRIGQAQDAVSDIVAVPVSAVGKPNLLLGYVQSTAREVAVSHGARDLLPRAVLEKEVYPIQGPVAKAIDVGRTKLAGYLVVDFAVVVTTFEV